MQAVDHAVVLNATPPPGNLPRLPTAGTNPLSKVTFTGSQRTLADVAPLKTPPGYDSKTVYSSIASNIEAWIEEAIKTRNAA